jgi:hypothetical protein
MLFERLIKFTWQFAGEEEETADIGWQKEVEYATRSSKAIPREPLVLLLRSTSLLPNEMCKYVRSFKTLNQTKHSRA